MNARATVIINPIAGAGRTGTIGACVDLAKSILAAHHYAADVRVTAGPNDALAFAKEAVAAKADVVVAWGGDGTVNGAAAGVSGTTVPLAIVPGGSGNGLARDLQIPFDPARAMTIAATGAVRRIDAGDLNGHLFFNVAGIGLDARIAGRLATKGHRRGLMGYVLATVAELRSYESCAYSISHVFDENGRTVGGDIIDRTAMFIALANSRQYGSGAQIAPKALLDDGLIEVVIVEPMSVLQILRQLPAFFGGRLQEGPGIVMRSAAALTISCARGIAFHVDGEPRTATGGVVLQTHRGVLLAKVTA
jgi:YegS/Rv2252/BmrU family lipid kinase